MIFVKELRPAFKFKWIYFVILFVVAGLVVARVAYFPQPNAIKSFNFQALLNYINPVLVFLVMIFSVKKTQLLKTFKFAWLVSFSVFGIIVLIQNFFGIFEGWTSDFLGRLAWPYIDPFYGMKAESANWLAFLFGPTLILATVSLVERKKFSVEILKSFSYWTEVICILISFTILFLTKSYTSILIAAFLFAWIAFINIPKGKKKYFLIALVVVFGIAFVSQLNSRKFQILIGNDKQETSLNRRAQIYKFNYEAFKELPLQGIGPGNYQAFFSANMEKYLGEKLPEIEVPPHPHNLIMFFWSDLGLFGLLAILMIYVYGLANVFWGTFSKTGTHLNIYSFVLLYLLGHGLMDLPYGSEENSVIFWTVLAMVVIQDTFIKNEAR